MHVLTVETALGKLQGIEEDGLRVFLGVPYARPPMEELRLRAPQPAEAWVGVRSALAAGLWAPQHPPASPLLGTPPGPQGEDCLTLNVWTPGLDGGPRPVLVWIHGGAFLTGSGASPVYRGSRLASRGDVVVVTINYRLGILGFVAHPNLADAAAAGASGNWGLLDQIAALLWVRDNITAFGGDPHNVTIFGESAGGMSVTDLLTAPAASGLFHKAIVQSGPPSAMTMRTAEQVTGRVLAETGVSRPEWLRSVPVDALLGAQAAVAARRGAGGLPLTPVVDGVTLPVAPHQAIAEGCAADIPLLIGTNRDEAKVFMVSDPENRAPDEAMLRRRIERAFSANGVELVVDDVIAAYRSARAGRGQPVEPRELWSAIETDRVFRIGSVRVTEAQARHQRHTYSYLFTWESPAMDGALGACHALEIPFVFGNLSAPRMDRFAGAGPAAAALSETMMDAWLAFVRSGDPSTPRLGQWPAYDGARRATMVFGTDTHVEDAPYDEERRVWESLVAVAR
jgi:para-nitrobenzyl esterase